MPRRSATRSDEQTASAKILNYLFSEYYIYIYIYGPIRRSLDLFSIFDPILKDPNFTHSDCLKDCFDYKIFEFAICISKFSRCHALEFRLD